jgi:hypothetical protein
MRDPAFRCESGLTGLAELARRESARALPPRFHMARAHPLTDHDAIRRWADERGGKPACVKGTGGKDDTGMIRLDFPGYSGEGKLQPISWDEWFQSFDDNDLALLVQDETAGGQRSNFNKLVARATAEGEQESRRSGGH